MIASIDFRSDTVTKPCKEMLHAMMNAKVGDDVYGEDPSVAALEEAVATLLGKEAALFVPSGTMSNQIALQLHGQLGDAVLCDEGAHIFTFEAGAAAAISGLSAKVIKQWDLLTLESAYVADQLHMPPTTLLSVENTLNLAAGKSLTKEDLENIETFKQKYKLKAHLDGARLWHAELASKLSLKEMARGFNTLSVCFSKGLGAPVGSALVLDKALLPRAKKIRKRFGGAMRQSGYLAAAAHFALQHNMKRLLHDHERAAMFYRAFTDERLLLKYPNPGSNMVFFAIAGMSNEKLVAYLREKGLLVQSIDTSWVRSVWHKDIPEGGTDQLIEALKNLLR